MESAVSEHIEHVKEWAQSFRQDVELLKTMIATEAVDRRARVHAATALNYLVMRMDLVPDWNQTIGVMDDVMVLRVCLDLAQAYGLLKPLEPEVAARVQRLIDDTVKIEDFLGDDLYAKLRKHCARLCETTVRGRSPERVVADEATRKELYAEVDEEILRMPATAFSNADDVAVSFKSYLHHKLA